MSSNLNSAPKEVRRVVFPRCFRIDGVAQVYARLTKTFRSGKTRPLTWRRHQILQLARMLQDNIKVIENALHEDLEKPPFEVTVIEISGTVQAAVKAVGLLEEWAAPERPTVAEWRSSWETIVYHEPKGVSLIIS